MTTLVTTVTETLRYRGKIGQWSWMLHRVAGLGGDADALEVRHPAALCMAVRVADVVAHAGLLPTHVAYLRHETHSLRKAPGTARRQ